MLLPMPPVALKIEEIQYDGKLAYRLSNPAARLVISPHLGRVVEFGSTNGPNVLWKAPEGEFRADGYRNVGGDKVWYAPQTIWNWPPDKSWDGTAMTATKLADGIKLASAIGKILPLRLTREIRLDPYAAKVTFRNLMTNDGPKPLTVALWQVTQVDNPTGIRLTTLRTAAQPRGYAVLSGGALDPSAATNDGKALTIRLHPTKSFKYGAKGGDGTLVSTTRSRETFVTSSPIYRRARYSDTDSPKQVYTSPATTGYAELEHLAPLETLDPRQAQVQTVVWQLKGAA